VAHHTSAPNPEVKYITSRGQEGKNRIRALVLMRDWIVLILMPSCGPVVNWRRSVCRIARYRSCCPTCRWDLRSLLGVDHHSLLDAPFVVLGVFSFLVRFFFLFCFFALLISFLVDFLSLDLIFIAFQCTLSRSPNLSIVHLYASNRHDHQSCSLLI